MAGLFAVYFMVSHPDSWYRIRLIELETVLTDSDLFQYLQQNEPVRRVLECANSLGLDEWFVGAGCVCQTVWNIKCGNDPAANIKDIDLIYFDSSDLAHATEKKTQAIVSERFADLAIPVEVVNEARVHLWYKQAFGFEIAPYLSSKEAINTWPTTASSIGVRMNASKFDVYAPFGLSDIENMVVRPNKTLIDQPIFESKACRWKETWPKLKVIGWNNHADTQHSNVKQQR